MAKTNEIETPVINLIGSGTVVKGDVRANGDMRVDGSLQGSLHAKGKIVVGPTGVVEGEVVCQSADFSGTVKANINVADLMILKSTALVTGEIKVGKLAIEPGAKFTGHCIMHDTANKPVSSQGIPHEEKRIPTP